jgi:hypothetical protein
VVVDPKGIVRGITTHVNSGNIRDFLAGKPVHLLKAYKMDERKSTVDINIPLLTYENGGSDTSFLYRSLLTKWNESMGYRNVWYPSDGKCELIGFPLYRLVGNAYTGKFFPIEPTDSLYGKLFPKPELEIKDSSLFEYDDLDGKYCYSLVTPGRKFNEQFFIRNLRGDMMNYFDFSVTIEVRKLPYWKLIVREEAKAKLQTKSNEAVSEDLDHAGLIIKNCPVQRLIGAIWYYNQQSPPIVDETGIEGNIDITINALLTDFSDIQRALKEQGLDLVAGEKEMKVVVVRDSKKQNL